jgi:hypothetical protein
VNKRYSQLEGLTVPNSTYTAMPTDAIMAPKTHIVINIPTLPDARSIRLGVANILNKTSLDFLIHKKTVKRRKYPVPIIRLNISEMILKSPE